MTGMESAYWLGLTAPATIVLMVNLLNALTWPRGSTGDTHEFSVLIPCRDEERGIEACIRSVQSQSGLREIVVYDDDSSDETPAILTRLAAEFPRLRVIKGGPLPDGWVGKPHACHRLVEVATAQTMLFLDADVVLEPGALERISSLFLEHKADIVTAMPRQRTGSFAERLVLPLLHLTYTSWLWLALIWRSRDVRFLAANGQILAVTQEAYKKIGGFEAVRHEVVDDMAFCRNAKLNQQRVVFADGHDMATCRMYENGAGVIEGFSKNIYEGVGSNPLALSLVLALYVGSFLLPFIGAIASLAWPDLLLPSIAGIAAILLTRLMLCVRHRHPIFESLLLHPLAIIAFVGIAINSWLWSRRGQIHWSGRSYAQREVRKADG